MDRGFADPYLSWKEGVDFDGDAEWPRNHFPCLPPSLDDMVHVEGKHKSQRDHSSVVLAVSHDDLKRSGKRQKLP